MTELSPAAEAIFEAFNDVAERVGTFEDYGDALAAALRVLANQVVPAERHPAQDQFDGFADWDRASEQWEQRRITRRKIRAIARELEGRG